jgi:hypothetical protein
MQINPDSCLSNLYAKESELGCVSGFFKNINT